MIRLEPMAGVRIQMPDGSWLALGRELDEKIVATLVEGGEAIVVREQEGRAAYGTLASQTRDLARQSIEDGQSLAVSDDDPVWPSGSWPAAKIVLEIREMSFRAGSRGERAFYGFEEGYRTPFNDGSRENEFPLRAEPDPPDWFEGGFDANPEGILDSRTGLDIADGFHLYAVYAWLRLRYAVFKAGLAVRARIESEALSELAERPIEARATGWYFDLTGYYQGGSAGISIARTDAMGYAAGRLVEAVAGAIGEEARALPLTAVVDGLLADGTVLLGTGPGAGVGVGTVFESWPVASHRVEVTREVASGALGRVIAGEPGTLSAGSKLWVPAKARLSASPREIRLAGLRVPPRDLSPWDSTAKALPGDPTAVSLPASIQPWLDLALLPIRVWRYFHYDRKPARHADFWFGPKSPAAWSRKIAGRDWAERVGLDASAGAPALVSILDTGVDYRHPALFDAISFEGAWDRFSGDARPFDDAYRGTAMAGLILAANPAARILPVKIFNPWGITSSAAIYQGFADSSAAGARVIVCGWGTRLDSEAIRAGVALAREAGAAVVAAAGDSGLDLGSVPVYPATLPGVLAVAAVDSKDLLLADSNHGGPTRISAPGEKLLSTYPRAGKEKLTGSWVAAALVAGALSREPGLDPDAAIGALLARADRIDGLSGAVEEGRRLRVR